MKRSRLLLLLAALIPLFAGCSKQDGGAFAGAKSLIIGTDATYPPFEMQDEKGQLTGVSIDMGRALGDYLKRPVEFNNMKFDALMTALKSGSVDIVISSMTANDERRKSIDFSDPYVQTRLAVLVSSKSSVKTEDDLKKPGCKIVVRIGTTGESYVHEFLPQAIVTTLDDDVPCVQEVVNGNVDAWVYDQLSLARFHEQQPDTTRLLLKPLREEVWAIGLRQGDDALRQKINAFLKEFRANGGFKKLAEKYLSKERAMMEAQHIPFVFDL